VAKLQTYKFVNPGVSNTKSPTVAAARKQTLALNRLGSTISGIGTVVSDIEKISIAQIKNDRLRAKAERRRERRELDQAAEEAIENKKAAKRKPKLTKRSLKIAKGSLSWVEKFLAPIGKFLGGLFKFAITKEILEWVSDPANIEKLTVFLEKTHFVFKKLFGWAAGFTNNILDGFSSLTDPNGTFAERLGGIGNIMKGLIGLKYLMNPFSLITDILGLVDLLGGGDLGKPKKPKNYNNRPSAKNPSGADPNIDGPRGRVRVKTIADQFGEAAAKQYKKILAEYGDDAARAYANALNNAGGDAAKALKAWRRLNLKPVVYKPTRLQKAGDFFTGLFDSGVQKTKDFAGTVNKTLRNLPAWAGDQYKNLSKHAQKGWDNVVKASNAISDWGTRTYAKAGDKFNDGMKGLKSGARKYLQEKVLKPLEPIIKPIGNKAKAIGQGLMDGLMKIPGMDKAADVLRKKGIAGFEGIAKAGSKLGKRAAAILPVVGGLVNLFFAYQRFSQGDSIGGLIEGTSGILDVFGLATAGATSVISMLMDGYMFVRDFVPQLQQGEEAVVDAMGLRGFKDSIDKVLSKLPGLGTIVNTLMSPFKSDEEKEEEKESKKGKKAWWDFAGVFTGKDKTEPLPKDKQTDEIKKNQWWDFLDLFPNRKKKPQEMFLGGLWKGIKKTVSKVISNPIVQIGASFIPGAAPIMAGLNMVASGNPLGALSMIPGVGGVVGQVQNFMASPWGQVAGNLMSGNYAAAITGGISQFNPKWGSIAGDVMSGNYMGALNTFNPKWGGIAQNIMDGNYGGALSAFNPEMGAMVTKGMAMIDSFRQDPMGLITNIAEQQGMGGVLKAVTGLFGGGDKITALTQIASEMGIDPKVLGAVKSVHQQALSEGGISAEYAMEQAMEFIPIPTIIEKIVPIPQGVAINTGGNQIVITAPNSLLERMK
tara:strand:+ start:160 stop:2958 length:2799 start_codon:yes stop_codon:yes gene_type:complete